MTFGDIALIVIIVSCSTFAIFCRWLWRYGK